MASTYSSFVEMCKPASLGRIRANLMHDISRLIGVAAVPELSDFIEAMLLLGYAEALRFSSWSEFSNTEFSCYYCEGPGLTWDHVIPGVADSWPLGTLSVLGNLVPVCGGCNASKGNRAALTWLYEGSVCKERGTLRALQLAAYQSHYLEGAGALAAGPFADPLLNEQLVRELHVLRSSLDRIELLATLDRPGSRAQARPGVKGTTERLPELRYEAEHLRPLLKRKWDEMVLNEYVDGGRLADEDRHRVRLACPLPGSQECVKHPTLAERLIPLVEPSPSERDLLMSPATARDEIRPPRKVPAHAVHPEETT